MKIYPSPHVVVNAKKPTIRHIPLAHTEIELIPEQINVKLNHDFILDTKKSINPYDTFTSGNDLVFNSNGDIKNIDLTYKNGKYIYEPNNVSEFTPSRFNVCADIKKNMIYSPTTKYNINITVDNIDKWIGIISLFGNAVNTGMCPPNITINKEGLSVSSLGTGSYDNTDFYFINSTDGKTGIDFNKILDNHTNIWLSIDRDIESIFDTASITSTKAYDNSIYPDEISISKDLKYTFRYKSNIIEYLIGDVSDYIVEHEYTGDPIIILHKQNKGYIIVSHSSLFDNLSTNSNIIYDAITKIFLKSYIRTETVSSWITDNKIDYIGNIGRRLNQNHGIINLKRMVNRIDNNINNQFSLINVIINKDKDIKTAEFIGADIDQNLFFNKVITDDSIDIQKDNGNVSLLTTKETIIYCENDTLYKIEPKIRTQEIISDDGKTCKLMIKAFKSSKYRINLVDDIILNIPSIDDTYYIIATQVNEDNKSTVYLIPRKSYIKKYGDINIAEVSILFKSVKTCDDIRLSGGGLPENYEDNYDMLDIGNLYGKQLRDGTSMIIRLPKYLKKYDKYINDSVDAWKNATTNTVIYYEDSELT